MLWLLVGSILTTLDAIQNLGKANNFKTNAHLEDHKGGSQETKLLSKRKDEDLRLNRNGCTRKLWNIKTGIMKSGVTISEKTEKEIK